ncbi:hypothetical protein BaRGS_00033878, partial [Batillaria attramentaria]
ELQESAFYFVWNKQRDKISRKNPTKNVLEGGMQIPDIQKQVKALTSFQDSGDTTKVS